MCARISAWADALLWGFCSGWSIVDDTLRPRFDNDPEWPWVMSPPSRPYIHEPTNTLSRVDWYMFGHGHEYKAALSDFTKVAGKITLPPKFSLVRLLAATVLAA